MNNKLQPLDIYGHQEINQARITYISACNTAALEFPDNAKEYHKKANVAFIPYLEVLKKFDFGKEN